MVLVDYISDLHLDVWGEGFDLRGIFSGKRGDWLVVAGDISSFSRSRYAFLEYVASIYSHVFFVEGNHDLYDREIMPPLASNVHRLHGKVLEVDGYCIAGISNWYYLGDNYAKALWSSTSNDSLYIFRGSWVKSNRLSKFEERFLTSLDGYIDLLITHVPPIHLPNNTFEPRDDFYKDFERNFSFATWVCGHQHFIYDGEFSGGRLLANPWGYPHEVSGRSLRSFELGKG